ncbi:ferredoxin [Synergistales bacterium]|nr:ferredoxin [Synergistales bacterium]
MKLMTQYLKGVSTLSLSTENCVGCGECLTVCPRDVLTVSDGKAVIASLDSCIECGACVLNCPANAIQVNAGVGCASAVIASWFTGREPVCDCSGGECC